MKPKRDDIGLDRIDRQILKLLQLDCKMALAKLGEQIGLSAPSVVERIRRLESEGFIQGYHATLEARRLGIDVIAFVFVLVEGPGTIDHFKQQISDIDDVLECYHITGEYSLVLKVKTRNIESLEMMVQKIASISKVVRTHTNIVFSTLLERTQLVV